VAKQRGTRYRRITRLPAQKGSIGDVGQVARRLGHMLSTSKWAKIVCSNRSGISTLSGDSQKTPRLPPPECGDIQVRRDGSLTVGNWEWARPRPPYGGALTSVVVGIAAINPRTDAMTNFDRPGGIRIYGILWAGEREPGGWRQFSGAGRWLRMLHSTRKSGLDSHRFEPNQTESPLPGPAEALNRVAHRHSVAAIYGTGECVSGPEETAQDINHLVYHRFTGRLDSFV
jgi:hypothetical protein